MAEEGCESRFVCKLCNKKFPCGKSLGGHMRSHVVANSAEFQERVEFNRKKNPSFVEGEQESVMMKDSKFGESGNGQSGYGLRENPKKTWRAVDSRLPLAQDKVCKQCGKGFQSLKALCGHMACHSDKGMKDDNSWTSENQKLVFDSQSDTEVEERRLTTRSSKSKRYKKIVDDSTFLSNNGSSSVSEIDGQDQEEVAMCLMLLSRDSGNKGGVNSVVESSDNNSVVMETKSSSIEIRIGRRESIKNIDNRDDHVPQAKGNERGKLKDAALDDETAKMENSDSGYFLDECAKAESDVSVDWFRRHVGFGECKKPYTSVDGRAELSKENEHEGDFMASRFAGTASRKREYNSENPEAWNESARMMKNRAQNGAAFCNNPQNKSKYECFNCNKTFKSYQALGGHRPCHKRSNTSHESRDESGENSPDDSTYYRKSSAKNLSRLAEKKSKPRKNKGHVCPFCNRVFKNGQALGGHKRSHFIGGHDESNSRSPVAKPDIPDLLDLNLPAPEANEDDGCGELFSW